MVHTLHDHSDTLLSIFLSESTLAFVLSARGERAVLADADSIVAAVLEVGERREGTT
jgi:hypothetical protein